MTIPLVASSYASRVRPVLQGCRGAIAAEHPLAVVAGQQILQAGGSAVDAMIAAQAVLCVLLPDACGLGGDMLCIVRDEAEGETHALNAAGAAPNQLTECAIDGGSSVTVPGIVHGWCEAARRWGRLGLSRVLQPAITLAREGVPMGEIQALSASRHRDRLLRGGAAHAPLLSTQAGSIWRQPALMETLSSIAAEGTDAFYRGPLSAAIVAAVKANGGSLEQDDLSAHLTVVAAPLSLTWRNVQIHVQPPLSQGVLLLMALAAEEAAPRGSLADHLGIEATEAAFAFRDRAAEGLDLLSYKLKIDFLRAGRRGGPRSYLHTAGVAVADNSGCVCSSLVSVFDDFGSAVYVPSGGFLLNNRAAGFTHKPNDAAPGKRPVHTLAPAMLRTESGWLGLATPGADGQVQVLLQILGAIVRDGVDLATAIDKPRWRSENGRVLIERGHPEAKRLAGFGHDLVPQVDGGIKFGAIVAAGKLEGHPIAAADWRRQAWSGVC